MRLSFDRGTLRLDDAPLVAETGLPRVAWDPRSRCLRAPAYAYRAIVEAVQALGLPLVDGVYERLACGAGPWTAPSLRAYQRDALAAWWGLGRRGVVVLPTGAGKTRVAVAALAALRRRSLVLVPTRVLLDQWRRELAGFYGGHVGVVGDGEIQIEDVTVFTFESGYRRLDTWGDAFGVLVVDEVHHFGSGARAEALETCAAPWRLGLTATPPDAEDDIERLRDLVGPIVFERRISDLIASRHLADVEVVRMGVELTVAERAAYERGRRAFVAMSRTFARTFPGASYEVLRATLSASADGRRALRDAQAAQALAAFPAGKRALVLRLLERHAEDKSLVFTARADDAYVIGEDALVPVITADVPRVERDDILHRFAEGRYRAIASARVLNEGVDVPDARVAIVAGAALGDREFVQRVGRVLRPGVGKRALVYDLVTVDTTDDSRGRARRRTLVQC